MDTTGVIQSVTLVILVLVSAFFSSAETAFSTASAVRLRALEEEGNARAKKACRILNQYSKMLSTVLIGNNVVNIAASALATMLALRIHLIVGIATAVLTMTVLLFGEIVPKTWAKLNSEKIVLTYSGVILLLMTILTPVIFLVDKLSLCILKLLRIDPDKKDMMTETELKTYVEVSHEDGVIESEEKEIIYNVFDFSDAIAKDIMIPKVNMVSLPDDAGYQEILEVFKDCMYTRLPLYHEEKDNIIGFLNMKEFVLVEDRENFKASDIKRDAYYTYEYKKSSDLLIEMRKMATNLAFVVNEYGVTVGMITLEDLLEEIVGEIRDEFDADELESIQKVSEGVYLIEGSMNLDDINDALGTELKAEDYDSIGGVIIEQLDHLPEDGEMVKLQDGTVLTVQGVTQNRIQMVKMEIPEKAQEEALDGGSSEKSESTEEA